MEVKISQGLSAQGEVADINIIIDVIRAFTTTHYAFLGGAEKILMTNSAIEALQFKGNGNILCGEIDAYKIEGFDIGNSPMELMELDVKGKTIIHKTSNGVKATLAFKDAEEVLVTGYSNMKQTAQYVIKKGADRPDLKVHIISSHPTSDDDLACAEYLKAIIKEEEIDQRSMEKAVVNRIWDCESALKFRDPAKAEFDINDLILAVTLKKCNFVMKVGHDELPSIKKISFA